jgi:hypothetical protein
VDTGDARTASARTSSAPQSQGYDTPDMSTQKLHSSYPVEFDENPESSSSSSIDGEPPGKYKVLYLAASLFEFNFSGDKRVGSFRYLTYQAGEVSNLIRYSSLFILTQNSGL